MHYHKAIAAFLFLAAGASAQIPSYHYDFNLTFSEYESRATELASTHRVSNIHGYVSDGKTLYSAAWERIPPNAPDRIVYIGQTKDEYLGNSSWNTAGYQPLAINGFSDKAGEYRYNFIWEKGAPNYRRHYVLIGIGRTELLQTIAEYGSYTPPLRPLWVSSWIDTVTGIIKYNLIYGPDTSQPEDKKGNIFATGVQVAQTADMFHEMIVSSMIRGMSPVTVSVVNYNGIPLFTSLWRKTAEVNAYPQWSVYREIDREAMEGRLEEGVQKGGLLRSLVAYAKEGDDTQYAAVVQNLPPIMRETYLPGQPLYPPITTTTTTTTLSCPPTTTATRTTTTRATMRTTTATTTTIRTTMGTTTVAKPSTTTRVTTMTTTTKTTATNPVWVRVTRLPLSLKKGGA